MLAERDQFQNMVEDLKQDTKVWGAPQKLHREFLQHFEMKREEHNAWVWEKDEQIEDIKRQWEITMALVKEG